MIILAIYLLFNAARSNVIFNGGGFGISFEINVGATETTLTATLLSTNVWSAIGFGNTMEDTSAIIFNANQDINTIIQHQLDAYSAGTLISTVWQQDSTTDNRDGSRTYVLSRSNSVSSSKCGLCHTFNSNANTLNVIYAVGAQQSFGPDYSNGHTPKTRAHETLTGTIQTDEPTAPTKSPTAPTLPLTIETKKPTAPTFGLGVPTPKPTIGLTLPTTASPARQGTDAPTTASPTFATNRPKTSDPTRPTATPSDIPTSSPIQPTNEPSVHPTASTLIPSSSPSMSPIILPPGCTNQYACGSLATCDVEVCFDIYSPLHDVICALLQLIANQAYACGGKWVGERLSNAEDDVCGEFYSACNSISHDQYLVDCTDASAFLPNHFYASNAVSNCVTNVNGIFGCGSVAQDGWIQIEDDCGSNIAVLNVESNDNAARYGWVFVNIDLDVFDARLNVMHRNSSIGGLLCCRNSVNTDETDDSIDDFTDVGSMGNSIKQFNIFLLFGISLFVSALV